MTVDDIEPTIIGQEVANTGPQCADNGTNSLPPEIMDIMEHLSRNDKIVFKSQQRNEPELQPTEKLKVAKDIYQRNPQTFLIRFGKYLEEGHLFNFARISIADGDDEMHLTVKDYLLKIKTRQQDVKNRRYAALQKLIKDGEYFSEEEMMKRSPELYQELVGQYLSSDEKKQRDSYDVKNTTFSGILMHRLVQNQISEIMEKAKEHVKCEREDQVTTFSKTDVEESDVDNGTTLDSIVEEVDEVPANCRQQWGNFDTEQVACSSSKVQRKQSAQKKNSILKPLEDLITADERELLRQEFLSQMHEQFLSGQDNEFDYTTVDDNTQFDDLTILNQDKEDKYFEESDDESGDAELRGDTKRDKLIKMDEDESEDELDLYMCHLNKHHSLQK